MKVNDKGVQDVIKMIRIFDHDSLMIHLRMRRQREEQARL